MANKLYESRENERFGQRQVPVWYKSSQSIAEEFQTIGKRLKIFKILPNPFPFYDWIMGFYERVSNRAALQGTMLKRSQKIIDVGAGTGYLLSRLEKATSQEQEIYAVDLSQQMLDNSKNFLAKHSQLSPRIHFEKHDCRELPWNDNSFDLYVSSYLFDLLPEIELINALQEMERVLQPDGYGILVTMTTELDDLSPIKRFLYRLANEFYCIGYYKGRWNPIWRFFCAGYAPHCRPIMLSHYLEGLDNIALVYTKTSRVSLFPVRVYYVRKTHS